MRAGVLLHSPVHVAERGLLYIEYVGFCGLHLAGQEEATAFPAAGGVQNREMSMYASLYRRI